VLEATGASFEDLTQLITAEPRAARPIPLIGLTQAGGGGFFDDGGFPVGQGWDQIRFPKVDDENAYALEVTGDSMQPLYRDGDILIVSPNSAPRKGDRIVLRTTDGDGEDPGAAHGKDGRACVLQSGPRQSRLSAGPHRLDGAHRLGESIADSGDRGP
jgi:hypothetical protein